MLKALECVNASAYTGTDTGNAGAAHHPNTTMLCRLSATGSPFGPHSIRL